MNDWLCLVISLPTQNATTRMRVWRALKASGAAVLRDGVYLLPKRENCRALLEAIATEVRDDGGSAHLLTVADDARADNTAEGFIALFDRSEDFAALRREIDVLRLGLSAETAPEVIKQARKLRKMLTSLIDTDFFPGEAKAQVSTALDELVLLANRIVMPDEPTAKAADIPLLKLAAYQGRVWATRKRPWVDRLASAWLIRRHIDPHARLLWLDTPADCPPEALGFDFDGAAFSHVGTRVTFEVLLTSFGLTAPALQRIGALVHYLDVGGMATAEAAGIERVLGGMREAIADDDQLFLAASGVFEGLRTAFEKEAPPP